MTGPPVRERRPGTFRETGTGRERRDGGYFATLQLQPAAHRQARLQAHFSPQTQRVTTAFAHPQDVFSQRHSIWLWLWVVISSLLPGQRAPLRAFTKGNADARGALHPMFRTLFRRLFRRHRRSERRHPRGLALQRRAQRIEVLARIRRSGAELAIMLDALEQPGPEPVRLLSGETRPMVN